MPTSTKRWKAGDYHIRCTMFAKPWERSGSFNVFRVGSRWGVLPMYYDREAGAHRHRKGPVVHFNSARQAKRAIEFEILAAALFGGQPHNAYRV